MRLTTTVVGSFPYRPSPLSLDSMHDGSDPFITGIEYTVQAQLDAGIDIVSDGQTRGGMINIFASKLGGLRIKGRPEVIGDIEYRGPITVEDVVLSDTIAKGSNARAKGVITGPHTMAMSVVDKHYDDRKEMAFAFAEALRKEVIALGDVVDTVQIDEPFLSVEYPEYAKELIEIMFDGFEGERALHVCGDVSPIFADLIDYPVDILDHEFYKQERIMPLLREHEPAQRIGLGSVASDTPEVEPLDAVVAHIRKALDILPPERIVLDPDCGLGGLPEPSARGKLEVLVRAAREVEKEA